MPGPTKEGGTARMQHSAWLFTLTYCLLNAILAVLLWLYGMTPFDALCHAFGALATGGFSTYNASVGHFEQVSGVNAVAVEYTIIVFMVLAGTNFTLLYLLFFARQPRKLLGDVEWRAYMLILIGVTLTVVGFGLWHRDFAAERDPQSPLTWTESSSAIRHGTFQVVSIMTTTGYGTHNFDRWNSFGRGVLFLLMFVGGCAGSTAGGLKVIRHVLFMKIMRLEIEHAFHPRVVRPLWLGGKPADDPELRRGILVYFCLILVIFVLSWMAVVTFEPDSTWGASSEQHQHKLIDSASGVAATLNNIGPGLGTVGATENYAKFSPLTKLLFVWLMMIGRLEIFAILVLFAPRFWRDR
jgi:trk system potassium uptake protein TrkH